MTNLDGKSIFQSHRKLALVILGLPEDFEKNVIKLEELERGREALLIACKILDSGKYEETKPYKPGTETFTRKESELLLKWAMAGIRALEVPTQKTHDYSKPEGKLHNKVWNIWADQHPEEGPFQ